MKDFSEKLSAYLDGALDPAEAEAVEARLAVDPQAQAEFDALIAADAFARSEFEAMLHAPVPFKLAQQIKATPVSENPAVPKVRPIWGALAAGLVVFAFGGVGGYALKGQNTPVQATGWLAQIADYHGVYASQGRHLVEVGADESAHIETWLGDTIGTEFKIPVLTSFGLTFEGGRLLVANGKPVAQLMYRQADGTVIALCLQRSNRENVGEPVFNQQTIKGFDFVSWSERGADYVVIGPAGQPDLGAIAAAAAVDI
jgi:anti-sigma factor RsiW